MRPDVPAWSGDLTAITDEQLDGRINALTSYLGNITAVWKPLDGWRNATPAELVEREQAKYMGRRLDALRERDRRQGMPS